MSKKIHPCLWFDKDAKAAADLYCRAFRETTIDASTPMVVTLTCGGERLMLLNGGPMFRPNPSISLFVVCVTKDEVDHAWNLLVDGGSILMPLDTYPWSERYGWVQDRYGVSWQLSFGEMSDVGQKLTPLLMFTGNNAGKGIEAIDWYTGIFKNSSVMGIMPHAGGQGEVEGTLAHAQFKLDGYVVMAMDSSMNHAFNFTEGVSLVVSCDDQDEIDHFWNALTTGGEESMCGWLKDKYGVSWQIVPSVLEKLMRDPERAPRVMQAFCKMRKFDIAKLMEA